MTYQPQKQIYISGNNIFWRKWSVFSIVFFLTTALSTYAAQTIISVTILSGSIESTGGIIQTSGNNIAFSSPFDIISYGFGGGGGIKSDGYTGTKFVMTTNDNTYKIITVNKLQNKREPLTYPLLPLISTTNTIFVNPPEVLHIVKKFITYNITQKNLQPQKSKKNTYTPSVVSNNNKTTSVSYANNMCINYTAPQKQKNNKNSSIKNKKTIYPKLYTKPSYVLVPYPGMCINYEAPQHPYPGMCINLK